MTEIVPLHLTLSIDGETLFALLSDGATVQQFAAQPFEVASLHGAEPVPVQALIPAAIAKRLRELRPGGLTLQLPPVLDGVNWERLTDGVHRLGDKFAIARVWVDGGADSPEWAALDSQGGCASQVAQVDARGLVFADLQADGDLACLRWASLPDVVHVANGVAWPALLASWQRRFGGVPALIVWSMPAGNMDPALLRVLHRLGLSLVVLAGADAAPTEGASWFADLSQALAAGCTVAEAARRVRVARDLPSLRVYGHAQRKLLDTTGALALEDGLRQVTVLKFDLVGSTRLTERLGDERYSELLEQYHQRCAATVRLHGGVPDDPQGDDGIVCYFGFPQAQEDAARRAVLTALDLVAEVSDLGIQVRVGVATDRLAVKRGQPVGRVVHLAARLQSLAEPGEVMITDTTRELAGAEFETVPTTTGQALKGIETPPRLHRVLRRSETADVAVAGGRARLSRFIGRQTELARLIGRWATARLGRGGVMVVEGEAGIGKSRLLREVRLVMQQTGENVLCCVCRQEWANSPFQALVGSLRSYLRLTSEDTPETVFCRIDQSLPAALRAADANAAHAVAALLSAPGEHKGVGSWVTRQRILNVLRAWFHAAAGQKPVCLMVDDAQWLDPSTREFLDAVIADAPGLPLLVVVAQRNEHESAWLARHDCETLHLQGIDPRAACELVRQTAGSDRLSESAVRLLASRADGVPLFLEESARMAADQAVSDVRGAPALQWDVPVTLEAVLAVRLDRLGPSKAVAQLGAVLGREFPATLLAALIEHVGSRLRIGDAARQLDDLQAAGLVLRLEEPDGSHYRFKHALVRDVAYQSIWERDRRVIHEAAATVMREHFGELARRMPELLAQHLMHAGQHAQAAQSWEAAARLAAARAAHLEGLAHVQHALAALRARPAGVERDRAELRLQSLLASRQIATEGYGAAQVEATYRRAGQLADLLGDSIARSKIDLGLEACYVMRADFARARALAEQVFDASTGSADPMQRLQALWAQANIDYHEGDVRTAIERMDRCLTLYRPEFHRPGAVQDPGVMCLCYSAWAYWECGNAQEALARAERVIALADRLGHRFSQAEAQGFAASVRVFRREHAQALQHAERAIAICEEDGVSVWLAHALIMRGQARAQLGEVVSGLADMQRGYALWVRTGAQVTRPFYLAMQAEGHLLAGDAEAAHALLREALGMADRHGERYHRAEILRLLGMSVRRLAQQDRGGTTLVQARELFEQSLGCARAQGKHAFVLRSALAQAQLPSCGDDICEDARVCLLEAIDAQPAAAGTGDYLDAQRWLSARGAAGRQTTGSHP